MLTPLSATVHLDVVGDDRWRPTIVAHMSATALVDTLRLENRRT